MPWPRTRHCPRCKARVGTARLPGTDGRAARRIRTHYVNGQKCSGSSAVVLWPAAHEARRVRQAAPQRQLHAHAHPAGKW